MTRDKALEILKKEVECSKAIDEDCYAKDCNNCEHNFDDEEFKEAINVAIKELEQLEIKNK